MPSQVAPSNYHYQTAYRLLIGILKPLHSYSVALKPYTLSAKPFDSHLFIWVVVNIKVPFWVRHLLYLGSLLGALNNRCRTQKGTLILTTTHTNIQARGFIWKTRPGWWRIPGLGFRVWVSGFWVKDYGFLEGVGFRISGCTRVSGLTTPRRTPKPYLKDQMTLKSRSPIPIY